MIPLMDNKQVLLPENRTVYSGLLLGHVGELETYVGRQMPANAAHEIKKQM
jgi:hypothetical protein